MLRSCNSLIQADTTPTTPGSDSQSVLNVSFAAVQLIDRKDVCMSQDFIKDQIYRKMDQLRNLSAVTVSVSDYFFPISLLTQSRQASA